MNNTNVFKNRIEQNLSSNSATNLPSVAAVAAAVNSIKTDAAYLKHATMSVAQAQEYAFTDDIGSFTTGWFYSLTGGSNTGNNGNSSVFIQAISGKQLDSKNAWLITITQNQDGTVTESCLPIFYDLSNDTYQGRDYDFEKFARTDRNNTWYNTQIFSYYDYHVFLDGGNLNFQYTNPNTTDSYSARFRIDEITGKLILDSDKSFQIPEPTDGQDAATVNYVDNRFDNLPAIDESNLVHKTGNESFSGTKTSTGSLIALGDTDPNGITAPFILRAAGINNQVAATMILDAELIGGKKFTFGSTGLQTGSQVGKFALYNATNSNYMFLVDSSGNGEFIGNLQVDGKIGIGETNPTSKLMISSNNSTNPAAISLNETGVRQWILSSLGGKFRIVNGSTSVSAITIDDFSKIGIGTDTPSQKLEVNGSVKADMFIGNGSELTDVTVSANVVLSTNLAAVSQSNPLTASAIKNSVTTVGNTGTTFKTLLKYWDTIASNTIITNYSSTTDVRVINSADTIVTALAVLQSQITNAPKALSIYRIAEYTATADGQQQITVAGIVDAFNVQVMESTGYVRNVYIGNIAITTNTLTISADANIKAGDKISGNYYK